MDNEPKFMNSTKFQKMIEEIVASQKLNHLDACIKFCNDNDIDFEDVKKLLTTNLRDKIKMAAMEDGYLKMESSLPI